LVPAFEEEAGDDGAQPRRGEGCAVYRIIGSVHGKVALPGRMTSPELEYGAGVVEFWPAFAAVVADAVTLITPGQPPGANGNVSGTSTRVVPT
jgi:hypothetical protein